MLANILRDRVQIQERVATQSALGETVVWKPIRERNARVVPLDAKARVAYQQLNSEVSHKIIFRGSVVIALGKHRLLHGTKTYEPIEPPQQIDNTTVVLVKEV